MKVFIVIGIAESHKKVETLVAVNARIFFDGQDALNARNEDFKGYDHVVIAEKEVE